MAEPQSEPAVDAANAETSKVVEDAVNVENGTSTGEGSAEGQVGTETAEAADGNTATSPSEGKKRKHDEAEDERDWKTRRSEDNKRESKHSFKNRPKQPFKSYSENVKSDYSKQPESSDPDDIRKQVEFYFSDSNLPTDKFLLTQTEGSANKPVAIKVIHSFKRMRHFQPYSAVVAALKDSDVLVVNDNEEVSRKDPLPESMQTNIHDNFKVIEDKTRPRTIYAKGFGEEGPNTQFDIEAFFAPYGPTNAIRLRRTYPEKIFKGSVFVEFDSDETAKQFLALENKPKFDGHELSIMSKDEYLEKKTKELARNKGGEEGRRGGRGDHHARRGFRGGRGGDRRNGSRREDRSSRRDPESGDEAAEKVESQNKRARDADVDDENSKNGTPPRDAKRAKADEGVDETKTVE